MAKNISIRNRIQDELKTKEEAGKNQVKKSLAL
jgi:hypothetical protein